MTDSSLFVTDLDGTLLRNDATLSRYSVEKLNDFMDQGLLFTFCTARSYQTASRLLQDVRLRLPCIVFNGVYLIDPLNGKSIYSSILDDEIVQALLELGMEWGISPFLFGKEEGREFLLYTNPQNEGQRLFLQNRSGDPRLRLTDRMFSLEQNITLNFIASHERLLPFKEWIEKKFQNVLKIQFAEDIYLPGFFTLEFYHPEADKGFMLSKLAEFVGVPLHDVTVFGDHLNDLDMFRVAGNRIAVANAHKDLLGIADHVIGSNEDNGVVHFLEQFVRVNLNGREAEE